MREDPRLDNFKLGSLNMIWGFGVYSILGNT